MSAQEFEVVVCYRYPVDMDLAEGDYGTTDLFEMAAIDEENLGNCGSMIADDLSDKPFKISVAPVQTDKREPYLIHYGREVERKIFRWMRQDLARNPQITVQELIDRYDPDKKEK